MTNRRRCATNRPPEIRAERRTPASAAAPPSLAGQSPSGAPADDRAREKGAVARTIVLGAVFLLAGLGTSPHRPAAYAIRCAGRPLESSPGYGRRMQER